MTHFFQGSRSRDFLNLRLSLISKAPLLSNPHFHSSNIFRASSSRCWHLVELYFSGLNIGRALSSRGPPPAESHLEVNTWETSDILLHKLDLPYC